MQQTPSVSIESLLTHDNFLRSLARTLITDPSSADDASQDAWVAALKRPPRSDSPRGWIATVVRNFVKQQFRARTRRETHERRAMRGVCVPSTAEIVVKEEIRRQVVEAVLLLDEHYRSVLLLRFYENLAPREIAEYYQIPVATVHTRIQRGLAILRTKLQKSYGSNWSCAVAALVPSLTWGGAGAAGSFIPAALLLQAKHMIAAAVAVVAIASATFVYLWIPPENTAGEIVSNGILGTAQDRELSNLENENDSLDATVPTSTESRRVSAGASEISNNSFMVRGRIVDPEGAPVANANIQFTLKRHLSDVYGPESVKSETTEVSTNANGNFELPIPNRDQSISYFSGLLKIQSESFASIRVDIHDIKSNASNSDLGNITVLPGATVRGRVLDANDRPTGHEWSVGANLRNLSPRIHAENCYVWPVIPSAKCNKETGEFIIKNVPLGTTHLSASVAEKYADYEIRRTAAGDKIDINPDETDEIIITYFPPAGWQENAVMFKFRWKREPAFSPADEFVKLIRRNGEVFASTPLTEHDPNDRAERYYFLDLPKEEYTIEINDPRFEKKVVRGVKPGLVNETNPPLVGLKGSCSIKVEALDAVQKYPLRNFWVDIQSVAKEIPAQRGTGTFPRQRICVHYGFDPIPDNGIFDNIIPGDWEVLLDAEGYTADPVIIKNLQPGKIPTVKFLAHRTQAESKPSDK